MERCCYIKDHRGRFVFIPGCMGAAAEGPKNCTCLDTEQRIEALERKMEHTMAEVRLFIEWLNENGVPKFAQLVTNKADAALKLRSGTDWVKRATLAAAEAAKGGG